MAIKAPSTFMIVLVCLILGLAGGAAGVWSWLASVHEGDMALMRQQLQDKEMLVSDTIQQAQQTKERLMVLEDERTQLQAKISGLTQELKQAQTDLERTLDQLAESQDRYDRLTAQQQRLEDELTSMKEDLKVAEDIADEAQTIQDALNRQLRKFRNRYTVLDRDYSVVIERLKALEEQGSRLPQRIADSSLMVPQSSELPIIMNTISTPTVTYQPTLESGERADYKVDPKEVLVELNRVVVDREQENRNRNIQAQVIDVDVPNQFIVIDKGSAQGVRVGMEFEVRHGSQLVGRLRVIRTRDSLSACDVLNAFSKGSITPGDAAVYQEENQRASL